jgi:hypothetical protein
MAGDRDLRTAETETKRAERLVAETQALVARTQEHVEDSRRLLQRVRSSPGQARPAGRTEPPTGVDDGA